MTDTADNTRKRKTKNKTGAGSKPQRVIRQCACGCKAIFSPERDWQRFIDSTHANRARQKRFRDRYRKLSAIHSGQMVTTKGKRKSVKTKKEYMAVPGTFPAEFKEVKPPREPPRNRSPESAPLYPSVPADKMTARLRNVRRVHPRSLENIDQ